jgi:hypothetical protein
MSKRSLCVGLLLALVAVPPAAGQDLRLTGQLRPRFEQRDPNIPPPLGDVTMRTRLGVAGTLPENIRIRLDVQDVIIWGGTAATPGFTPAAEVSQAFAEIGALGAGLTARIGRQEMSLGNQRLVSNNNWAQRPRRFDGARLLRDAATLPGNAFAMRTAESGQGTGVDAWFHGVHAVLPVQPGDSVHLFGLYNRQRGLARSDQYTAGGHGTVRAGAIGFTAEAYLQRGTRGDRSVIAHMFSLAASHAFDRVRIDAGYDRYSGDPQPGDGTARAFDRLAGSFHAYHGYADLFTDVPATTAQRGLGDAFLRTTTRVGARTDLELNGHLFHAVAPAAVQSRRFGEELDAVLRNRLRGPLTIEGGASYVRTGPALTAIRPALDRDLIFGYLMGTLLF